MLLLLIIEKNNSVSEGYTLIKVTPCLYGSIALRKMSIVSGHDI